MLDKIVLEKIVFEAMKKFSRENKGSVGWNRDDIEAGVLAAGGEMTDVYRGMSLGMRLCSPDRKNMN